jgi:hypothetical protein
VRGHRLIVARRRALGRTPCARVIGAGRPRLPWPWPGVAGHRSCGSPAAGPAPAATRLPLCPALPGTVAASASLGSALLLPLLVSLLLLRRHRLTSHPCPGSCDVAGPAEVAATACTRGCPLPSCTVLPLTLMAPSTHVFLPTLVVVLACAIR